MTDVKFCGHERLGIIDEFDVPGFWTDIPGGTTVSTFDIYTHATFWTLVVFNRITTTGH